MATINLGNVVALLKSETAPTKKYVLWGQILNPSFPDLVELHYWDTISSTWTPVTAPTTNYWLRPVISNTITAPPLTPIEGDRYLIPPGATGVWSGNVDKIATYKSLAWVYQTPLDGYIVSVRTETNTLFDYRGVFGSGGAWYENDFQVPIAPGTYIPSTEKNAPLGLPTLDSSSKILASQISGATLAYSPASSGNWPAGIDTIWEALDHAILQIGTGSKHIIADDGTSLPPRAILAAINGLTAEDDNTNNRTTFGLGGSLIETTEIDSLEYHLILKSTGSGILNKMDISQSSLEISSLSTGIGLARLVMDIESNSLIASSQSASSSKTSNLTLSYLSGLYLSYGDTDLSILSQLTLADSIVLSVLSGQSFLQISNSGNLSLGTKDEHIVLETTDITGIINQTSLDLDPTGNLFIHTSNDYGFADYSIGGGVIALMFAYPTSPQIAQLYLSPTDFFFTPDDISLSSGFGFSNEHGVTCNIPHTLYSDDSLPNRKFITQTPDGYFIHRDDFFVETPPQFTQRDSATSGAGIQKTTTGIGGGTEAFGISQLMTGTSSTGWSSLATHLTSGLGYILLSLDVTLRVSFRIRPELLQNADEYKLFIGFADDDGSTEPANGAYFRYTSSSGGKWEVVTRDAGTATVADSGHYVPISWEILSIEISPAAARARFKITGSTSTLVDLTTNIPTSNFVGIIAKIVKTVGTNSRSLYLDWYQFEIIKNIPRVN